MKLITSIKKLTAVCFFIVSINDFVTASEIDHIHFLIPGGQGGGWDGTARDVGKVLTESKLVNSVSYENVSGEYGGKALSHLIDTAKKQKNTLIINSSPIVIRSLQKFFPNLLETFLW